VTAATDSRRAVNRGIALAALFRLRCWCMRGCFDVGRGSFLRAAG